MPRDFGTRALAAQLSDRSVRPSENARLRSMGVLHEAQQGHVSPNGIRAHFSYPTPIAVVGSMPRHRPTRKASLAMLPARGMIPSDMPENDRTERTPPWHPPGTVISKGAIALLMISPLLHIGEAIVAGVQGRDLGDLTFISPANVSLVGFFGAVDLVACILFCIWWYRAHQNLRFLRVQGLTYTPRAAVWAFFIPFIHLVRPQRVADELWRASNATTVGDRLQPSSWHSPAAARWWTCFVLAGFMRGCVNGEDGKPFGLIVVVAYVLLVVAATYAIELIREIDSLQQQRFTEMQRSSASAITMPTGAA